MVTADLLILYVQRNLVMTSLVTERWLLSLPDTEQGRVGGIMTFAR